MLSDLSDQKVRVERIIKISCLAESVGTLKWVCFIGKQN